MRGWNTPKQERLTVRVDSQTCELLHQEAKERKITISNLLRSILTNSVSNLDLKHEEIIGRLVHLEEEISLHRRITCAAVTAVCQLETSITQFHESPNTSIEDIKDDYYTKTIQNALAQGDDLNRAILKNLKNKLKQ